MIDAILFTPTGEFIAHYDDTTSGDDMPYAGNYPLGTFLNCPQGSLTKWFLNADPRVPTENEWIVIEADDVPKKVRDAALGSTEQRETDLVMYSASFMSGMRDAGDFGKLLERWNRGCVGLTYELTRHVATFVRILDAIEADCERRGVDNSYPGVIAYEVAEPFGIWFAGHVIETGEAPSDEDCRKYLLENTIAFFSQNGGGDLRTAIAAATAGIQS